MEHITVTVSDEVLTLYNKFFPNIKIQTDRIPDSNDKIEIMCSMLGDLMDECEDNYDRETFNETAAMIITNILHLSLNKARELAASFEFEPNITN